MSLFQELKRRNVFKVGAAYLVLAWIVIQIADAAVPALHLPEWVNSLVFLLGILGFPFALFFAWAFELTPDGIKKDSEIEDKESMSQQTGKKLNFFTVTALVLALLYISYQEFNDTNVVSTPPQQQQKVAQISIAVLPFENMSNDPSQEYFSDGMTEEILNVLAKNKKLLVAARTSAFAFKGKYEDIRTIGKSLGVANVLEGSVRRSGDDLRITAQLIRVEDGFHLWSENYNRKLDNIFVLQEEIAADISIALEVPLGIKTGEVADKQTTNMAAYDLFLQGRQLLRKRGISIEKATNLMDLAIQKDDQYAPAWALKSILLMYIPNYLSSFNGKPINLQKIMLDAGIAARKAVRLDPNLAIAHFALANFYRENLSWAMAEDEYLLALKIDPANIDIIEDYSQFLQSVGRLKESIKVAKMGFELEPYTPMALVNYADKLFYSSVNPDAELILELIQKALKIQPDFSWAINLLSILYIQQKEYQKAFDGINNCVECRKLNYNIATMYYLEHILNSTTPDLSKESLSSTISIDLYYSIVGEEGLLDIFEQIHTFDNGAYIQAPFMHKVRATERYKTHVKFLGLADYWRLRHWPDYCRPISETDFVCD